MKTIIAPIDFSNASANALAFAAELANRASAHLIITTIAGENEDTGQTENELQSIVSGLKKSIGPGFNCEGLLARGNLIAAIKKIIKANQADLIVMGTKGASGLKKILIGSNTVNVIAKTRMPVLVIPEVARFKNFLEAEKNRIVLATDLDLLQNEEALDILKTIALLMIEPKVRVVSVRPKNTVLPDLKKITRSFLLSLFKPEIETERITVFSTNVIDGINFYLDKNTDTGLLAMIARNSGNLIQKHYTREMASQTHLPLLVLHDTEI